ncbi:MAG: hypothetical protein L3J06_10280 [Cyclobacteriaceae bacterium]|nr:hypothetical protein [Cyclobacteriaceae bacterium]
MGRRPEGKAEKIFKTFGKNVDSMISDIKESEKFTRLNIDQRVAELNKNRASLGNHFSNASHNAKSQWKEAKPNFERAGQEFRKALNVFFTHRAYH